MTSNILAGERRWASARRTGMTVLGKVSVPKPLNLPSQRLENHGLDPNVEIVPKGSVGWGSRPSSSASNPWGSSSLSPNADGSASSPSHLSGRPSSGGSGSRPSTAGSERTHERSVNAWGPSSRSSSASGTASNQVSLTSLRPHSAETRPSSSQLSRFAEPMSDSVARGPVLTAEKVVVASFENEGFSLSSGEFPTLNSSKESSAKNSESRDQGSQSRPSSASDRVAQRKEWTETSQADVNNGPVNRWKRDGQQNAGSGNQPSMEKWHGEPQTYHNANMPPPLFDAWRGPPMNAPAGVWYRGPPPGPPYGAPVPPVAPGGFPVEPFPYYCPQIPPAALANSQSVPLPGAGPRPRQKNGEMFRPQLPDAFVPPGMPFRPGFYHSPMPFDGYYGPPMGYCNPNEREVPFKGSAAGPPVYNRYRAPNVPDSGNSHARTDMNGSTGKTLPGQVETAYSVDTPGQYKVLLKQNNEWHVKEGGESRENMPTSNSTHSKKGGQPGMSLRKNEWGDDNNSEDEMYPNNTQVGNSSHCNFDDRVGYNPDTIQIKSLGSAGDVTVEDSRIKKSESSSYGMSQASSASGRVLTASERDSTLMQKIEGLNEKVRAFDGRNDSIYTSQWEEQKGITGIGSHEMSISSGDKTSQLTSAPRRAYEGVRSKNNDNGKRRFNSLDIDGWQKKPVAAEAFNVHAANVEEGRMNPTVAAVENPLGKSEGESLTDELDSTDSQAQRAKMRELAKQRAIQLQKEEEERIKEQKAKAFAKLEELNRRTQGVNALNLMAEKALPIGVSQHEKEGPQTHVDSTMGVINSQFLTSALASTTDIVTQVSERTDEWGSEAAVPVSDLPIQTLKVAPLEPVVSHGPLLPLKQEMHNASEPDYKTASQLNEADASRCKHNSHKPKQNPPSQLDTCKHSAAIDATKAPKDPTEIVADVVAVVAPAEVGSIAESSLPSISNFVAESSAQQRGKSSRNNKSKHKLDGGPSGSALPLTSNESNPVAVSTENEMSKASQSDLDSFSVGAVVNAGDPAESSDQRSSLHSEGVHGKLSNHRKPQQFRRFSRNQQTNRFADKYHGNDNVMWAPVRSQSKPESATETGQKTLQESVTSTKGDNQVQNNLKSKRAEIERYVPKPVAKELAQQGGVQQSVSSPVVLSTSDETAEKGEPELVSSGNLQPGSSANGSVVSIAESREGDSKRNKQPKVLGAWHQRGPTDSLHVKGLQNDSSSSTSNPCTNAQISGGQNQSVKTELTSFKADRKVSREFIASDCGNMLNDPNAAAPVITHHRRDQGVTGKGKRHALKGERNKGYDNEREKNLNSRETDRSHTPLGDPSINQSEKFASSRESRGFEERTSSQWQPKSNLSTNNGQRGSRTIVNQGATREVSGFIKKDHSSQPRVQVPQHVNRGNQLDQSGSENKIFSEVANVGHQGHGKERKLSSKGRPYSPSEGLVGADESSHAVNADTQNKQHVSSDFRRNRNPNNRPNTNRESRADWNQERHRQNAHYEYQPVGPYNNNKGENFEDLSNNMDRRYKDRGQSHPKRGRGNFHGRQSGNVRVDAGYG